MLVWRLPGLGRAHRAQALSAVALVVAARVEPMQALRRLAAEDSSVNVLARVAHSLGEGLPLVIALARHGLLTPTLAQQLERLAPEQLAEELRAAADDVGRPSLVDTAERWLPLMCFALLVFPWLGLQTLVISLTGHPAPALIGSHQALLDQMQITMSSQSTLMVAGGTVLGFVCACLWWWGLTAALRWAGQPLFSRRLFRAQVMGEALRSARAGVELHSQLRLVTRIGRAYGETARIRASYDAHGGDLAATLVGLGVLPLRDGKPDWDQAWREQRSALEIARSDLRPPLLIILGMCTIVGVVIMSGILQELFAMLELQRQLL